MTEQHYVGAIDQGTTSTRFMVFDHDGHEVGRHQLEHEQHLPRPGWVEHDPTEIWQRTQEVVRGGLEAAGITGADLVAVGITNQRETTVVWDPRTGEPYAPAIVWQDTRTDAIINRLTDEQRTLITDRTGLVPATYFAGGKLAWLLQHIDGLAEAAESGNAVAGTVDSWLVWQLTGGAGGTGRHVTDITNAARTMLMDLERRDYDDELLDLFGVPRKMLPEVLACNDREGFGTTRADGPFGAEVPITGVLGDQHAATVGQACFDRGEAKNTYGTGNFLLLNTGDELVRSSHGLLTTPAYWFTGSDPVWALEGSIAVTGSAVQWLRDQLGVISSADEIEELAGRVDDSGGVCFVPAFSGLFAPYWRSDARGAVVGLSRHSTSAHLARATLEAICYQTRDVLEAMTADSGVRLDCLKVDGGVTANELCMQLQADVLGTDVSRPAVAETTALGAAYAAGLGVGFWTSTDEVREQWAEDARWSPRTDDEERAAGFDRWHRAVDRSLGWVDAE